MSAKEFRERIEANNKSQGEVAELLGVSLRSVNRWANAGGITPPVAAAIRALLPKK